MLKRLLSGVFLAIYSALLIEIMVFKNAPVIRIGHLRFNFGGPQAAGEANLVPFKTILLYLLGEKGQVIAIFELIGNIILLVPIGFIVPVIYRKMTWQKSLVLAVATGLIIEGMQAVLRVGIFDIDDVILNGLGIMLGFAVFTVLRSH